MHGDCPTANSVNFFQSLLSGSQATYLRRPVLLLRTGNMINVGDRDVGSSLCQRNCNSASDTASPSSNKSYLKLKHYRLTVPDIHVEGGRSFLRRLPSMKLRFQLLLLRKLATRLRNLFYSILCRDNCHKGSSSGIIRTTREIVRSPLAKKLLVY